MKCTVCMYVCISEHTHTFLFSDRNHVFLFFPLALRLRFCEQFCTHQVNSIIDCISMNRPMDLRYVILPFSSNYIPSDFKCTNTDVSQWLVRDSVKSFPSGHASVSTYTAVFMMVSLRTVFSVLIIPQNVYSEILNRK